MYGRWRKVKHELVEIFWFKHFFHAPCQEQTRHYPSIQCPLIFVYSADIGHALCGYLVHQLFFIPCWYIWQHHHGRQARYLLKQGVHVRVGNDLKVQSGKWRYFWQPWWVPSSTLIRLSQGGEHPQYCQRVHVMWYPTWPPPQLEYKRSSIRSSIMSSRMRTWAETISSTTSIHHRKFHNQLKSLSTM